MPKNLQDLIALLPDAIVQGEGRPELANITHDSRKAGAGSLFVCIAGVKSDGHNYAVQACRQGAAAVLTERALQDIPAGVTVVQVKDTREAMRIITPYFYDYPSRKMRMIGITGTNGKTTTTYLLRSILQAAGFKVGVIGTIQNCIGDRIIKTENTTPDVIDLQALLAEMAACGVDYTVMEVSSHALAQERVTGCEFDTGIFSNVTQDHLDYHGTLENYLDAKLKLFSGLGALGSVKQGKTAVINADDPAAAKVLAAASCRTLTYAIDREADLKAEGTMVKASGTSFTVKGAQGEIPLQLKITGRFNVYNVLAAIGAALAENIAPEIIKNALEHFESVAGRFELVQGGQDFSVIVDYAHTPDGLENILKTAKQIAQRRIIVVFGCGGDRDRGKRPLMGKLAAEYGDVVIATSDNPRTEDPAAILEEIEVGILQGLTSGKLYEKIIDRRQAIYRAITMAEKDDLVIIAGKGHENYQILGKTTIDFDDKLVAKEVIEEILRG